MVADGPVQRHVLMSTYLQGDLPPLLPQLGRRNPLHRVCLLAGSAAAQSTGGLAEAWRRSLSAHQAGLPLDVLPSELREALDVAAAHVLVQETPGGDWRPPRWERWPEPAA